MNLSTAPLTPLFVEYVLAHMTEADRAEILATGVDAQEAFAFGLDVSTQSGAVMLGDTPVAIFGVAPDPQKEGHGVPWMVCTDEFRRHPRDAMYLTVLVVELMQSAYPTLHNVVHAKHTVARRWLEWGGFEIGETLCGPGHEFLYFKRESEVITVKAQATRG